jgi:hypothetical protein
LCFTIYPNLPGRDSGNGEVILTAEDHRVMSKEEAEAGLKDLMSGMKNVEDLEMFVDVSLYTRIG